VTDLKEEVFKPTLMKTAVFLVSLPMQVSGLFCAFFSAITACMPACLHACPPNDLPACPPNNMPACWLASYLLTFRGAQVSTIAVNYRGLPFMRGLLANRPLVYTLGALMAAAAAGVFGLSAGLSEALELVPVPPHLQTLLVAAIGEGWGLLLCLRPATGVGSAALLTDTVGTAPQVSIAGWPLCWTEFSGASSGRRTRAGWV